MGKVPRPKPRGSGPRPNNVPPRTEGRAESMTPDGHLAKLAAQVRSGQVSAAELVRIALERIASAANLNAVTQLREEAALREAEAIDRQVAQRQALGPLAGLPVAVKDLEDVVGLPTTFGSLLYRDAPPATRDSLVPRRLRAAGAIVVGKTNLSEFAFKAYASNRLYGSTRNPWNLEFSPGGSSGGSAAALAAGLVPLATASDGGGSVRIPAALCGLVGLKPTNGIIGRDPIPPGPDLTTDGVLATSVADVRLLLQLLAGPTAGDPGAQNHWRLDDGMPRRMLAATRLLPGSPLPAATQSLFDAALADVSDLVGIPVEVVSENGIFKGGNIDEDWFRIFGVEQAYYLGRSVIESNEAVLEEAFVGYMHDALGITLEDHLAARRRRYAYTRELDELLGDDTVIVTPTVTVEGWSPDGYMPGASRPGLPLDAFNTQAQNMTGHPAVSLPAGHFPSGIPFGLQVTGPRFRDGLLLEFAAAWEAVRPWALVAPGFVPFGSPGVGNEAMPARLSRAE